jgi:hypothetical protein
VLIYHLPLSSKSARQSGASQQTDGLMLYAARIIAQIQELAGPADASTQQVLENVHGFRCGE